MSGGVSVPFTALSVYADTKYSQSLFAAMAFVAMWFAAYRVWKVEHDRVMQFEKKRSGTIAKLQGFYISIETFIKCELPKDISEDDFRKYVEKGQTWLIDCTNWIGQNMGEPAKARFLDRTYMLAIHPLNAVNDEHITIIRNCLRWRQNLLALIENSDVWDKGESIQKNG